MAAPQSDYVDIFANKAWMDFAEIMVMINRNVIRCFLLDSSKFSELCTRKPLHPVLAGTHLGKTFLQHHILRRGFALQDILTKLFASLMLEICTIQSNRIVLPNWGVCARCVFTTQISIAILAIIPRT